MASENDQRSPQGGGGERLIKDLKREAESLIKDLRREANVVSRGTDTRKIWRMVASPDRVRGVPL